VRIVSEGHTRVTVPYACIGIMATFQLASRLASRRVPCAPIAYPVCRRQASTSVTTRSITRTVLYVGVFTVSAGLLGVYYLDARSALHRYCLTPIIRHTLDAENGHKLAVRILMSGLAPRDPLPDHERLRVQVRKEFYANLLYCLTILIISALGSRTQESGWPSCRI
jgi:hypothetical protein